MDAASKEGAGHVEKPQPRVAGDGDEKYRRSYQRADTLACATEWEELVKDLAGIHLTGLPETKQRPGSARSRSDETTLTRTKRSLVAEYLLLASDTNYALEAADSESASSSDEELGAPPLLPPALKRARGGSFSPKARKFSDSDTPRQ